jgi:hypothetical protein
MPRLFPRVVIADRNGDLDLVPYDPKTMKGPELTFESLSARATDAGVTYGLLDRYPWIARLPQRGGRSTIIFLEDFTRR